MPHDDHMLQLPRLNRILPRRGAQPFLQFLHRVALRLLGSAMPPDSGFILIRYLQCCPSCIASRPNPADVFRLLALKIACEYIHVYVDVCHEWRHICCGKRVAGHIVAPVLDRRLFLLAGLRVFHHLFGEGGEGWHAHRL